MINHEEEVIYEFIVAWDEGGGKRSRRDLARGIVRLYKDIYKHDRPIKTFKLDEPEYPPPESGFMKL